MIFVPFEAWHMQRLEAQEAQRPLLQWLTPEISEAASRHFALTGIASDGRLVGAAGVAPVPTGQSIAWAVFSSLIASHALPVTRLVHRVLGSRPPGRIEAYIDPDHSKAAAFAERLHFQFERVVSGLHPSGRDLLLYAHLRA